MSEAIVVDGLVKRYRGAERNAGGTFTGVFAMTLFQTTALSAAFVVFMVVGTALFVRAERNR